MKLSVLLKIALAFIVAGLAWNYSQVLIYIASDWAYGPVLFSPSDDLTTGPLALHAMVCNSVSAIGGAIIAFLILFVMLPKCSRSTLAWNIAIFACLSVIAALAFNFWPVLSGGRSPGSLLITEIIGSIVGASLALICIRFKAVDKSGS